jgi:hypothetical protein
MFPCQILLWSLVLLKESNDARLDGETPLRRVRKGKNQVYFSFFIRKNEEEALPEPSFSHLKACDCCFL